jgi:hypothetical protein
VRVLSELTHQTKQTTSDNPSLVIQLIDPGVDHVVYIVSYDVLC